MNYYKRDFRGVDFRQASLRFADFRGSDLTNADLSGVDLTNAVLTGAKLKGAKVDLATMSKKNRSLFEAAGVDVSRVLLSDKAAMTTTDLFEPKEPKVPTTERKARAKDQKKLIELGIYPNTTLFLYYGHLGLVIEATTRRGRLDVTLVLDNTKEIVKYFCPFEDVQFLHKGYRG